MYLTVEGKAYLRSEFFKRLESGPVKYKLQIQMKGVLDDEDDSSWNAQTVKSVSLQLKNWFICKIDTILNIGVCHFKSEAHLSCHLWYGHIK